MCCFQSCLCRVSVSRARQTALLSTPAAAAAAAAAAVVAFTSRDINELRGCQSRTMHKVNWWWNKMEAKLTFVENLT